MNEQEQLIVDTTKRILTDLCTKGVVDEAERGIWPKDLWHSLEETGLTRAGLDEEFGGSGGAQCDALRIIREAAGFAAPIPLAETFIAASMLASAGVTAPSGPLAVCSAEATFTQGEAGVQIQGKVENINFAEFCGHLLLVNEHEICLIPTAGLEFGTHRSLAGGHRGQVSLDTVVSGAQCLKLESAAETLFHLGAISRVNMMAGAMSSILNISVQFSLERQQFGRSISQFQAIQQQLAVLAGEVAACQRAADSVLVAPSLMDIAVAKARVGEAVTKVADISHQVHGAMGYTLEHGLNLLTRRLWDWRDEYGNETYWQIAIGQRICAAGADQLWPTITDAA